MVDDFDWRDGHWLPVTRWKRAWYVWHRTWRRALWLPWRWAIKQRERVS